MSDAARASLVAVRAAQDAARKRVRRQTRRSRAWLGGVIGGLAIAVLVFGPRVGRNATAPRSPAPGAVSATATGNPPAAASARLPSSESVAAGAAGTVAAGGGTSDAMGASTAPAELVSGAAAAPVAAASDLAPAAAASDLLATPPTASDTACAETFGQRRWRLSIEACTQAFQARPNDAGVALRIAHAHHARARLPEAGEWAKRAIALDAALPEAFVIVAHSETHAGRSGAAVEAYRRYLALAPRGWHASEARAAVRAHARQGHARLHRSNVPPARAAEVQGNGDGNDG